MSSLSSTSSLTTERSTVFIYNDEGVNEASAEATKATLRELLDEKVDIEYTGSCRLKDREWEDRTLLLVMVGGSPSAWEKDLEEKGMLRIHDYVFKHKGKFLGICAGAYFSASSSYFLQKDKPDVIKQSSVALFSGKAVGPMFPADDPFSIDAVRAYPIALHTQDGTKEGSSYYQGGCFFELEEGDKETECLAHYGEPDPEAASAISCCGGDVVLLGFHPEFKWDQKNKSASNSEGFQKLTETLSEQEAFRQEIWKVIAQRLALPVKV